MKIVDVTNTPIRAAMQFKVDNCLVSVSTIMNPKIPEIAIFSEPEDFLIKDGFHSIEEAITYVHNLKQEGV